MTCISRSWIQFSAQTKNKRGTPNTTSKWLYLLIRGPCNRSICSVFRVSFFLFSSFPFFLFFFLKNMLLVLYHQQSNISSDNFTHLKQIMLKKGLFKSSFTSKARFSSFDSPRTDSEIFQAYRCVV